MYPSYSSGSGFQSLALTSRAFTVEAVLLLEPTAALLHIQPLVDAIHILDEYLIPFSDRNA